MEPITSSARPFRGGIHRDDMGMGALPGQPGGHVGGVAAEEFRIFNAVAPGVLSGVVDGLGDDLGADGPPRLPGQAQGDGADAAVEIQNGLGPGESGVVQGHAVEHLSLGGVDLIEGWHRQSEGKTAHLVHEEVVAPKGTVGIPKDHIGFSLIHTQNDAPQTRLGSAERNRQFRLMGQGPAVAEQAYQALSGAVGADIEMTQEPGTHSLIVCGNGKGGHVVLHRLPDPPGALRLEKTVGNVGDRVSPGGVEADAGPVGAGGGGELHLVSITLSIFRSVYYGNGGLSAADAGQTVLHLLPLKGQLLVIGHVPQGTAAAEGVIGAVGLQPGGRGLQHLCRVAPGAGFSHLVQPDKAFFSPEGVLDEAGHAVGKTGDPRSVGAVALYGEGRRLGWLFHHSHDSKMSSRSV